MQCASKAGEQIISLTRVYLWGLKNADAHGKRKADHTKKGRDRIFGCRELHTWVSFVCEPQVHIQRQSPPQVLS